MERLEKIFFGTAFSLVLPLTLYFFGLEISKEPGFQNSTYIYPVSGIIIGFIFVLIFLKKLLVNIFNLHEFLLYAVYIFYSILLYSFFTLTPVFNLLLSLPTGYYVAKKCIISNPQKEIPYEVINQYSRFSAYIISMFVVISTFILLGKAENLSRYIYHSSNVETKSSGGLIYRLLLYGGGLLIFLQYYLTKNIAIYIFKRQENKGKIE